MIWIYGSVSDEKIASVAQRDALKYCIPSGKPPFVVIEAKNNDTTTANKGMKLERKLKK
eukprot:CAMPEP_0173134044 /NCGR_PEP_ID=MMETSP1105-20130129/1064_1 /TAXON_ID=2985 /ORGANISM="Ochromonas sp., Strain BG-1" /LENGTH=58 /DNA_ID=CAMNT_0014045781 /DNA_START=642 /DNA_END=818 /DNA_ORIENTATION=-